MSNLKAVLFDVDGTLAETERHGHLVAFNETFKEFGLDWEWSAELYGKLLAVTGSTERTYHYVETYDAPYKEVDEDLDRLIKNLIEYKNDAYVRIADSGVIPLRPGAERVLREINDSDIRMAVVTTTGYQNVESLLNSNIGGDVMSWFDVIAAGSIVAHKKPAPDIYHLALKELSLHPDECIALEDSENGVKSAMAADVPVVVIMSEYSDSHDLSGAALIVDEWGNENLSAKAIEGDFREHDRIELSLLRKLV